MSFLDALGRIALDALEFHGRWVELMALTVRGFFRRPFDGRAIATQVVRVGVEGLPVVLLTAVFTGAVLALQTYTGFQRFHAEA
ncbi:MAG TPA: ABC transporter permease, partial [Thermoanaerobaculia bacterium]|nr:ABC transporter permease [Thermoanaerobaculia bacterium]HQP88239.1 ABC transporter permease [Thermoanaerobaculia bacterium]